METQSKTHLNYVLKFGLLLSAALISLSLLFYVIEWDITITYAACSFITYISGLYWGIKQYRNKELNGYISYRKALGTGVLIVIVLTLVMTIYNYFYLKYINTDMTERTILKTQELMEKFNTPEDKIEEAIDKIRLAQKSPIESALNQLKNSLIMGAIVSAILSLFIKKNDPSFESNFK
jgi:hypothetical protein